MSWVLLVLVRVYRLLLAPMSPRAVRAVLPVRADAAPLTPRRRSGTHGAGRGAWLAARRLLRCHPLGARGLRSGAGHRGLQGVASESMEKRVVLAIALCVGVLLIWQTFFPPPQAAPPAATAPVAGQNTPAPAPGAPPPRVAGRAPPTRRPVQRHGPRSRTGPSGCVEIPTPDVNYVFSSLGGTLVHAQAAREAVPRRRKAIRTAATTSCARTDAANAPLRIAFPTRASPRRPTAPGRRASRRPTRSCSRPTSATSTSRSATASTRRATGCSSTSWSPNRGDAASAARWPCRSAAGRIPTRRAAASSRACRPTSRRRSATTRAATTDRQVDREPRARSPITATRRTGHRLDRDRREVLPARRRPVSREPATAHVRRRARRAPTPGR